MPKNKPVWEKPNPKKKSKPLTAAQKSRAKAAAKKAGRRYPNLVDNMRAGRGK
jgi:ribosomal protein L15E